ncbi:hypothetical protein PHYBOEH_009887 [Phytophthora boehmeriae]|uniref:M96 mating-specific protein family n=1 Tax=Phytophthora boehmeriae TaxID=109152 RepID=A0A8T1VRC7_9STRA|nr:hypothetical protein PHYBOEH_009887 [Phytophthora boehmeriae]
MTETNNEMPSVGSSLSSHCHTPENAFQSKTSLFARAHSLEIPDQDLGEDGTSTANCDDDFQSACDFLDTCAAEDFWGQLAEPPEGTGAMHTIYAVEVAESSDGSDATAESKTRTTAEKPTRARRITSKQKIDNLRDEVAALTSQLQELKAGASTSSDWNPGQRRNLIKTRRSQLWRQIAVRQLERRNQAEKDNAELREMMEMQVQEAKNLRRVLKRRARIEMMKNVLGIKDQTNQALQAADNTEEDSSSFEQMLQDVDLLYAQVEKLFEKKMQGIPCPGQRRHANSNTLNGACFELARRDLVPFSASMTEEAVWTALEQPELQDLQCVPAFKAGIQFHMENTSHDKTTAMSSFFLPNPSGAHVLGVKVRKVIRKYAESDRAVFICQSFMEPKLLGSFGAAGTSTTSTMVVDVRKGGSTVLGDDMTLIQSHFSADRYDEGLAAGQRLRLPANLDMAITVLDESVSRIYRHVESSLMDKSVAVRNTCASAEQDLQLLSL